MKLPPHIENLISDYSNSPILRTWLIALGTVVKSPNALAYSMLAQAADIFLCQTGTAIQNQRIEKVLQFLAAELDVIDQLKVDDKFFITDKWHDLLTSALEKTKRTRDDEKLRLYARILRGAITRPNEAEDAEVFLDALAELSINELRVAQKVFEARGAHSHPPNNTKPLLVTRIGWNEVTKFCDANALDETYILQRIAKTGLIKECTGLGSYENAHFEITATFDKMMKFIESNGAE